ncbi:hypothetical protein GQ854_24035 [Vibrio parahaemolyticus]|nr:hypothetical protein [Vibrio parahaemolyticus]
MGLVVKVLCGHFCIACPRPLTRRYVTRRVQLNGSSIGKAEDEAIIGK